MLSVQPAIGFTVVSRFFGALFFFRAGSIVDPECVTLVRIADTTMEHQTTATAVRSDLILDFKSERIGLPPHDYGFRTTIFRTFSVHNSELFLFV